MGVEEASFALAMTLRGWEWRNGRRNRKSGDWVGGCSFIKRTAQACRRGVYGVEIVPGLREIAHISQPVSRTKNLIPWRSWRLGESKWGLSRAW